MRVCSPQLGLSPKSILGGEVYDREILLGLAKRNVKIEIILPKGLDIDKNIKNWSIVKIPIKRIPAPLFNFLVMPYLFLVYKRTKFEIIRLHSPQFIGFGALFFKFFVPKVKIIATYHQFRESKLFGLGKILNKYWDHIITDSKYVRAEIIEQFKVNEKKITAIHNGVPEYLKAQRKDLKTLRKLRLEGKITLMFMGLFIQRKNPLFILDVLNNLKREDVITIFWGKGPLKTVIIKRSKNLGLYDQIRILNPVYGLEKNKIHNLADVFVHPALDEGFALAPLESMGCAKPLIMNFAHSATEVVENKVNGFLCETNNVKDWSHKINILISNPKLRAKMGAASLEKVKREFRWSKAIEKHLDILRKITYE